MALPFYVAYAVVIFAAMAAVGILPGLLVRLILPLSRRLLLLPALAFAFAGWIWVGWVDDAYGISRAGLVLYAAVAAAGFVRGWLLGIAVADRIPSRQGRVVARDRRHTSA